MRLINPVTDAVDELILSSLSVSLYSWCLQTALMVLTEDLCVQTLLPICRPLWRGQEASETPDPLPSSQ